MSSTDAQPSAKHISGEARARRASCLLRRFRTEQDGVTAVEFAMVSIPFFALIFAILEGALVFLATQVLESAVADAARQIYTGQFQTANAATLPADLPAKFKAEVCKHVSGMFDCTKLKADVRACSSFPNGVPSPIQTTSTGTRQIDPNFGAYLAPGPNQVVLVRAAVEYPVYVSLLDANKSNLNANTRVLIASAAFRTEPYLAPSGSTPGPCV